MRCWTRVNTSFRIFNLITDYAERCLDSGVTRLLSLAEPDFWSAMRLGIAFWKRDSRLPEKYRRECALSQRTGSAALRIADSTRLLKVNKFNDHRSVITDPHALERRLRIALRQNLTVA